MVHKSHTIKQIDEYQKLFHPVSFLQNTFSPALPVSYPFFDNFSDAKQTEKQCSGQCPD